MNHNSNLIPFRLSRWKSEAGLKVFTREGIEVKSLTFLPIATNFRLVGVVDGETKTWDEGGNYLLRSSTEHRNDLMMEAPITKFYFNTFEDLQGMPHIVPKRYESKETAEEQGKAYANRFNYEFTGQIILEKKEGRNDF